MKLSSSNVVIFGAGVCGLATSNIFDHEVDFYDPPKGAIIDNFSQYHWAIIAVPTPQCSTGLDHSIVEESIEILFNNGFTGTVLIRSTCDPLVLDRLEKKYKRVIFWPEFLREAHAVADAVNPSMVVIGGAIDLVGQSKDLLESLYHAPNAKWVLCSMKTAATIKLALNSALASKVALFNSIYDICDKVGADWNQVRDTVGFDTRIGIGQTQVPGPDGARGFGGKCLPKDIGAFLALDPENLYLSGVVQYNNHIRG